MISLSRLICEAPDTTPDRNLKKVHFTIKALPFDGTDSPADSWSAGDIRLFDLG